MQLFIILALLLYGGKSDTQKLLQEVKPVLESIGGDDVKQAIKSAEEISEVLSAVRSFTGANSQSTPPENNSFNDSTEFAAQNPAVSFPLAPIANIADRDITYSLSQYVK